MDKREKTVTVEGAIEMPKKEPPLKDDEQKKRENKEFREYVDND